ncbi:MAG: hypothetical protein SFV54_15185 [Bryobacteraceae bacterium]|nr:hypothetical protein [Bryobacteraceae bacterium]
MDRRDLQTLARLWAREASALLKAGYADGAYYLAGYAVECALKACIAKGTRRGEFPDRHRANESHTHDFLVLAKVAGLLESLQERLGRDAAFRRNWELVRSWSERSRYQRHSVERARAYIVAVNDSRSGVFMDKALLVSVDWRRGAEVVEAFDRAGLKASVVMWAKLPEFDDWRLVISGRSFDTPDPRDGYRLMHAALEEAGFTVATTPITLVLPTSDPFIKALRKTFGKAKSVEGMRLGGQVFGDQFIEDGIAYRIE